MEFSIKTSQYLPLFSIFVMDGQMNQVTGFASDYTLCQAIDWDDLAELTELDTDLITEYGESYYEE